MVNRLLPTAVPRARAGHDGLQAARRQLHVVGDGTPAPIGLALRAFVGSRMIVWTAALVTFAVFGHNAVEQLVDDPRGLTHPFHGPVLQTLFAPAARWDAYWYLAIAQHGYSSAQLTNFYPLYPLLVAGLAVVLRSALIAGLVISLAALLAGLALLYRLALLDLDQRSAALTVVLVAVFPTSLFFSAVYTESLSLLLSVGAVYAARREEWMLAGICGCLAAATRPTGIVLMLPLAILYWYGPRARAPDRPRRSWWHPRYQFRASAAWILLVPAGVAAYLAYLAIARDGALEPFRVAHDYWGHSFTGPFGAVVRAVRSLPHDVRALTGSVPAHRFGAGDPLNWNVHELIDFAFLLVAGLGLLCSIGVVPVAYIAYAVALLAETLSYPTPLEPLQSLDRYLLVIFPLFMGVAARLAGRPRATLAVVGGSGLLLAVFSGLWAYWAWVA